MTLCATPTQHKTEETQDSLNTAKANKCCAENTVQHKTNSSPCASQRMLRLKLNELDREYRTLQASLTLAGIATKIESAAKPLFATMFLTHACTLSLVRSCSPGEIQCLIVTL